MWGIRYHEGERVVKASDGNFPTIDSVEFAWTYPAPRTLRAAENQEERMVRRHVRKWFLLVGALYLSGCYSYVPTELGELPVGKPVRVQLSRQAFADLPQISDRQGARLEGTLVRRSDADLTVHVPLSLGSEFGQELTLPRNGIIQSDVKVLNRTKSALLVAGGVLFLASAVVGTNTGKPIVGNPNEYEPPPSTEDGFRAGGARVSPIARILSFSIPLF